ncbi:hypothetical protein SO694_00111088 [Aureococcus anophagefferens]|uniref:GTP diphosphokinase n=1 Tax=Aureococcus anophagefferens TaxID=44056 RepID=A0ABR1FWZ5_AURAN
MRRSGEPFIVHPVAVAGLLCGLGMDRETVAAGLLHDTVEDTAATLEEIEATFGADVRAIVEGETKVSKLPKLAKVPDGELDSDRRRARASGPRSATETAPPASDKEREQLENLRQMFISMTDDYRIIIVKLADRLHNMRTLEHMPRHKQLRIARETLEIFAPLAHRLGLWTFKAELEDWAFRYAHPGPYAALEAALEVRRSRYESALKGSRKALEARLAADPKLRGVKLKGCEAVPRVKDYISFPKPNGYQSLHASLRREAEDQVVEVQIRTAWMHEVAEHGMAAHWLYKDGLFSVEDLDDDGEPADGRRGPPSPTRAGPRAKLRAYFREEQRLYEVARQKTIDSAM